MPLTTSTTPRKNSKEKETTSKSDTNAATTITVPVPTPNNAPPLLVRLLQFGLAIQPPSDKTASVEQSGGKTPAAVSLDHAQNTEPAEPKMEAPHANLAFALRLTNSDSAPVLTDATTTPAPQASSEKQLNPSVDSAKPAQSGTVGQPTQAARPLEQGDNQLLAQTTEQDSNRFPDQSARQDNSKPASQPAQQVSNPSAVQPTQQGGNQSAAQDSNHNSKQQHDGSATSKVEPATPAVVAPAAPLAAAPVPVTTTPAPASPQAPIKDAPPVPHAAATNEVIDKPAVASAPAQRISLTLSDSQNQRVDVHLMERAGEVRVSVHAADEGLTHSMRADLGSLSGKLTQSGYSTESFAPTGADSSSLSNQRQPSEGRESAGDRQNSQQNQNGGQQQQSRDGRGQRPAWVEEMENSLASNAAIRSNTPWQA